MNMAPTHKILIIVTNAGKFEKIGFRTRLWLGEPTHFWEVAEEAGYQMDIASPSGGKIPIDPESLIMSEMGNALGLKGDLARRYEDKAFMNLLENTLKVSDVDASAYDAIYMTGDMEGCLISPKASRSRNSPRSSTKRARLYSPSATAHAGRSKST
jgi:putative intracellular protease/amidase